MVYTFSREDARERHSKGEASGSLTAPMAGVVAEVLVTVGQYVGAYQPLIVIESMKVMTTIEAPFAGLVKTLSAERGRQVHHGEELAEITPAPEPKVSGGG
jgi:pyruvate carboxylase